MREEWFTVYRVAQIAYPRSFFTPSYDQPSEQHSQLGKGGENDKPIPRMSAEDLATLGCNFEGPHDSESRGEATLSNKQFCITEQGKPFLTPSLPYGAKVIRHVNHLIRVFFCWRTGCNHMARVSHALQIFAEPKRPKATNLLTGRKMIGNQNDMGFEIFHGQAKRLC